MDDSTSCTDTWTRPELAGTIEVVATDRTSPLDWGFAGMEAG
jgi:hypothetical protein